MDERTEANQIIATDVNSDFEREVSLYRLIGNRPAVDILKILVEQHQNDSLAGRYPELKPILLLGNQSRTTVAFAMHNAFGNLNFVMNSAYFFSQLAQLLNDFFDSNDRYTTYYIRDLELLNAQGQLQLFKILKNKRIYVRDKEGKGGSYVRFQNRLVILSATNKNCLIPMLLNEIPIQINLGSYSTEEIFLILKQRISFLHWSISSDEVLKNVAQVSNGEIKKAMEMLSMSYRVMRSKGEDELSEAHFNKALHLLDENMKAATINQKEIS